MEGATTAALTVKVTGTLLTLPAALLTVTVILARSSAIVVAAVI